MLKEIVVAMCAAGLLVSVTWGAEAGAAGASASAAKKEGVWRLAVQAYSFNRFSFFEAIDKAKELGLKYIEAYPGQLLSKELGGKWDHNASKDVRDKVRAKLKEAGVKMVNYGVVDLGSTEESMRKVFDFAKDMGIETIVTEAGKDTLEQADKLAQEYKINVAIHNHPKRPLTPSYKHWDPKAVLEMVKDRSKRVGACADTGHWPRSGVDPVEGLKVLEGRIISLHFKDLNERAPKGHDVPWGEGKGNAKGMLEELKRQGFSGVFSIEYEHNWENSMPEIAQCIKWFHATAKELGQKSE